MNWCIAEFPDREEPCVWVGSTEPAVLMVSLDGQDWQTVATITSQAVVGEVVEWPEVVVDGELRSIPEPGDGNLLWVCGEVLSFGEAELVAPKRYKLGRLLRGLRGTPSHEPTQGEQVMLLSEGVACIPIHRAALGRTTYWKAVPDGGEPAATRARPFAVQGLRAPRLDGSRPSVRGHASTPPARPRWGERYIVRRGVGDWAGEDGAVYVWLDRWFRETVEPGSVVWDETTGYRTLWTGSDWIGCS